MNAVVTTVSRPRTFTNRDRRLNGPKTQRMAKYEDGIPLHYPCMTQKDGMRRVHHPDADPIIVRKKRVRRAVARLLAPLRA